MHCQKMAVEWITNIKHADCMKIKMKSAIALGTVVAQLNVGCLDSDSEKLALVRLGVRLKHYAMRWDDVVRTARGMDPDGADGLLEKEAQTEVEIGDDMLISMKSAEKLVLANCGTLPAGTLGYALEYLAGKVESGEV